jgi:hypothetical protein
MDEKQTKKWKENLEKVAVPESAKDKIMAEAEDYEKVAEETQKLIMKFIMKDRKLPPTVAFAMTQELSKLVSTIATYEILKAGKSNINEVLGNTLIEEGGPMLNIPEDILNGMGLNPENLMKAKNNRDNPDDVMFR